MKFLAVLTPPPASYQPGFDETLPACVMKKINPPISGAQNLVIQLLL